MPVFNQEDMLYWTNGTPPSEALGFPTVVAVPSAWHPKVVLNSVPHGRPKVATRKEGWEKALTGDLEKCKGDIVELDLASRQHWDTFVGSPGVAGGVVGGAAAVPPSGLFATDSSVRWPEFKAQRSSLSISAAAGTAVVTAAAAFRPEVALGILRDSVADGRSRREEPLLPATMSVIEVGSVVLVRVSSDTEDEKFPLPLCVCEVSKIEGDSTLPRARVTLLWWRPGDEKNPDYSCKWVPWLKGSRQWSTEDYRGIVAVAGVQVKASSVRSGKLSHRHIRLTAASIFLAQDFKEAEVPFDAAALSSSASSSSASSASATPGSHSRPFAAALN